jgi:hypothetical protein
MGYRRVDGVTIATDWAQLTDSSLDAGIDVTELSQSLGGLSVWTHTQTDGTAGGVSGIHCQNWTSGSGVPTGGDIGNSLSVNRSWTAQFAFACNGALHLYCFQQS